MNRPIPAIVSQAGARPLSRWALLLVCAAYVLPGQLGRDAWRHADLTAFGYMASLARGDSSWWHPLLGGQATPDGALLPYWLGAACIRLLPFVEPSLAARLPFMLSLVGVLALVWYASFHLARTQAAQPVSFAFGGEAPSTDYARALADAAVLALMASLGLLVLGHETTPELLQLLGGALWLYALACVPVRPQRAQGLAPASLLLLTLSGAPSLGVLLGGAGWLICHWSRLEAARQLRWGLGLGVLVALAMSTAFGLWRWRWGALDLSEDLWLLAWFTWPTGAMAAWTLWRWREFLTHRHVAVPSTLALIGIGACLFMGGNDRALVLALPGLAVMASFALPTLNRNITGMIDWFSVFFFSLCAVFVWAYYLALQTDWLPRLTANVQRLSPGFQAPFEPLALIGAAAATLAWLALVRWRTSRQRPSLWRSLVLPASGTSLVWLLALTLWLAPINHARSNQALLLALQTHLPRQAPCVAVADTQRSLAATLEALGGWTVRAAAQPLQLDCPWAVLVKDGVQAPDAGSAWTITAAVARPTERGSRYWVLRRLP